MKAVSLVQPWASLIAVGEKRIETRSWATRHRGPLAIHASASKPPYARTFCDQPEVAAILARHGLTWENMPRGAIVATCELIDCTGFCTWTKEILRAAREITVYTGVVTGLPEHEWMLGDYTSGRYGFILDNVRQLQIPETARGSLSLWNWEPKALDN